MAMGQHPPSEHTNPGCLAASGVQSIWKGVDMTYDVARLRAKAIVQTRMIMRRYSVVLSETEARFAWGDR